MSHVHTEYARTIILFEGRMKKSIQTAIKLIAIIDNATDVQV